jgi:hypothetical protein
VPFTGTAAGGQTMDAIIDQPVNLWRNQGKVDRAVFREGCREGGYNSF